MPAVALGVLDRLTEASPFLIRLAPPHVDHDAVHPPILDVLPDQGGQLGASERASPPQRQDRMVAPARGRVGADGAGLDQPVEEQGVLAPSAGGREAAGDATHGPLNQRMLGGARVAGSAMGGGQRGKPAPDGPDTLPGPRLGGYPVGAQGGGGGQLRLPAPARVLLPGAVIGPVSPPSAG